MPQWFFAREKYNKLPWPMRNWCNQIARELFIIRQSNYMRLASPINEISHRVFRLAVGGRHIECVTLVVVPTESEGEREKRVWHRNDAKRGIEQRLRCNLQWSHQLISDLFSHVRCLSHCNPICEWLPRGICHSTNGTNHAIHSMP